VKGEKNVIFINVNWGLGSGLILDGKLYYGKSGYSGEFGHISAFDNEIICGCGKKGCLETEASGFAMQRILKEKYEQGSTTILADILKERGEVSLSDFVDAVLKEDMLAIEIVEHIGINLGRWLAGLINLFNPELVIIGGPLSLTQDYIQFPIKSALKKYSLNLVNQDTKLKMSKLGERAGLIGACLLSRSKTLDIL
jgi:predicted NBD/HSP70 family sugar kinase